MKRLRKISIATVAIFASQVSLIGAVIGLALDSRIGIAFCVLALICGVFGFVETYYRPALARQLVPVPVKNRRRQR